MMLRRTRADQVVPVFERFIELYPILSMAAQANPDAIRRMLYPLGLAWRAENMITVLKEAFLRYGDSITCVGDDLRTLPGVGDYVSGAIACFAGSQPVALIDTNVVRVLGRVFGVDFRGEARRRRDMRDLADTVMDRQYPSDYHYALLDFAALICTPKKPTCRDCPSALSGQCTFYANNKPEVIPGEI